MRAVHLIAVLLERSALPMDYSRLIDELLLSLTLAVRVVNLGIGMVSCISRCCGWGIEPPKFLSSRGANAGETDGGSGDGPRSDGVHGNHRIIIFL